MKLAIECKYQKGSDLSLTKRDLDGVNEFQSSGFIPTIAFLWMDINANWMLVKAGRIKPGKSNKIALGIHELKDVSEEINSVFPKVLDENFNIAINRGAEGIRTKLS